MRADFWYNVSVRRGQAMVEYVLAFSALLVVVAIMAGLVAVARNHAVRTEGLVSCDCP